ncbi:hypothetical protein GCM10022271_17660 [Corallibacter vietnamensis]|uniref:Thioredoxin domain-containing protein n=1 Tax=Corallibacter vietnamensis TaxID=904130 RepID=A0ABP7HDC5_9FLAO
MKQLFIALFLCLFSFNTIQADNWLHSFEEAKKLAIATNKLVLVDFWATWCGPCKRMDSESWSKEDVQVLMDNYIPVKIDIDRNRGIAQQYGVNGIPFIFILDGNGKVVFKEMSYKNKSQLIKLLKKYAINTSLLSRDLINYYQKNNFTTAFRLGCKYQDFTLYVTKDIKDDFLNVSETYFEESKKQLKESSIKNKHVFLQKMELYEIQELLILNKPEKALKKLDRIDVEKIDKLNTSLYNFINYVVYKLLDDDKAKACEEKLNKNDKQKALLFLEQNI